jgi:hypothetical protein
MKTLEEKKLLIKMARMLGQPVDQALVESIEREEKLAKILFKEEKKEEPKPVIVEEQILVEADPIPPPPPPVPAFTPPTTNTVIDVVNVLKTTSNANNSVYRDKELEGMRRTIAEMMQKISTMSWGGGGTGIVRIWDADDFDRNTVGEGKFMKFSNGWFVLDDINPSEIVHNTTIVNSNTYVVTDSDYYIGVNVPEYTTIILPLVPSSGRMVIIKDESGNAQRYPIKLDGNIDNDPGGAEIRINNGGVQLIYRNGWRIV